MNFVDPLGLVPPPNIPPGVDMQKNIDEASNMSPFEFYNAVRNGGKWDYKQMGRQYEDFGNYNFGAIGRAAGFCDEGLKRGAGAAQRAAGTSKSEWGTPWGSAPYGDDPNDQRWINEGSYDYQNYYNKYRGYSGSW